MNVSFRAFCSLLPCAMAASLLVLLPSGNLFALEMEEVVQLLAEDRYFDDRFGYVVAVDGDTALIGAPADDDLGDQSGSVYVYVRDSTGTWTNTQKLVASNGGLNTKLGFSLALEGDTALVGALAAGGTAYVFMRDNAGVWSERQKLRPSDYDPLKPGWFSFAAVALDGNTAIICAHRDSLTLPSNYHAGSAYVFVRDGTDTWSEQQKLIASDFPETRGNDGFCSSVDLDGDRAVIGAVGADEPAGEYNVQGAAYMFSRDSSGWWTEQQRIVAGDGGPSDFFGWSVALDGGQAVIGAPGEIVVPNTSGTHHGAAYVFTEDSAGVWVEQQKLYASDLGPSVQYLGRSMAIDGNTLVIGAPGCDNGTGAAYLFGFSDGSWSEHVKFVASDGLPEDDLGGSGSPNAVGLSGSTTLAGAPRWDMKEAWGANAGAAYIFEFITNTPPVAEAGVNQSIHVGELVLLDGSGSSDAETDSLDLLYSWQFEQLPPDSLAELVDVNTMYPSFTADVMGDYLVSLMVTDEGDLSSALDAVLVSSFNTPPNADAGEDQGVLLGASVFLDGSASFDPDDDPLGYTWGIQQRPQGSVADLVDAHTVAPWFQPDLAGAYEIALVVSDGYDDSASDTVAVLVTEIDDYVCELLSVSINLLADMPVSSFTTKGNKNALGNFLRLGGEYTQLDEIDEAQHKLEQAFSRTDGCILRGSPDVSGGGPAPKKDFIINCPDQELIYPLILEALESITLMSIE